jgi:glycosyltransferase involved in cell wall biosynthesis
VRNSHAHQPRILIFGQSFNLMSGGGITLWNTFKAFPSENIAFVSEHFDYFVIDNYKHYRFGTKERKYSFPFNFLQSYKKSGPVRKVSGIISSKKKPKNESILKIKSLFIIFLQVTGIFNKIDRINLSEELLAWILEFDPDIIYTQLSTLALIESTLSLKNKLNKKLVIHIMDDWPQTINKTFIRKKYWQVNIEKKINKVFDNADLLLSICEPMSEEYWKRYNKRFIPFHNSIEIERWAPSSKTEWKIKDSVHILYAGRIGPGTSTSLIDIAEAVTELNLEGLNIRFNIQTKSTDNPICNKLRKFSCVNFNPYIDYHELPKLFANVDILVLPIDFDEPNLKFIQLSMPTKVPEYMICGTPIFIYAPGETALVKYAEKEKWAQIVSDNSIEKIKNSLKQLVSNEELRKSLGTRAMQVARKNHDNKIVSQDFMNYLSGLIKDPDRLQTTGHTS